jgi:hypothetical protein
MKYAIGKLFAASIVLLIAMPAQAATCPDPTITGTGMVTVTTTPTDSTCLTYGGAGVDLSSFGLVLLDSSDPDEDSDLLEGALTILEVPETGIPEGKGTFSISGVSGYTNLTLVVKDGNLNGLQWGAFTLAALSGTWSLQDADGDYHGLSHGELWGSVSAVPVPAAAWLFGTALIGFIGFSRRTKV